MVERLRGVIIANKDAKEVMAQHDSGEALHFVDPPYLPETRDAGSDYRHEMTAEQHEELLAFLPTLQGQVVLCGYPSELYDTALAGWHRVEREALADGARKRTEVLWLNPANQAARQDLFTTISPVHGERVSVTERGE